MPDFLQPARQCAESGATLADATSASSCDGGPSFTCLDQTPTVDASDASIGYAFAATPGTDPRGTCGGCFELRFTGDGHFLASDVGSRQLAGKRLIVQATNIGYDVHANQFDVMIPGGGVGAFDACTQQWGIELRNKSLGARYGGFLSQCLQDEPAAIADLAARKACVRRHCEDVFAGAAALAPLLQGCHWFVDFYEAADNPRHEWRPVHCPAALTARSAAGFSRDPSTYLLTSLPPPSPPPMTCLLTPQQVEQRCKCDYQWDADESQPQAQAQPTSVALTCMS